MILLLRFGLRLKSVKYPALSRDTGVGFNDVGIHSKAADVINIHLWLMGEWIGLLQVYYSVSFSQSAQYHAD